MRVPSRLLRPLARATVYDDGTVCISILHPPEADQYGYEDAGERWLPVHSVESILLSVISLLSSDKPNTDSPANVDAAKQVREDFAGYKKKVSTAPRSFYGSCKTLKMGRPTHASLSTRSLARFGRQVRRLVRDSAEEAY